MSPHTLVLWDIDGTLLHSTGAGERALVVALREVWGIEGDLGGVEIAGRTDRHIARHVLRKFGLAETPENVARYLEGYLAALPACLAAGSGGVLPGIGELLARLRAHGGVAQGLLTGNLARGAAIKLGHHGLWEHFPFGAFADDAEHRDELGPHALRRAREHTGTSFTAERVWVIGDTPHDIACARAIGARALAVATGRHPVAALGALRPDHVCEDLADCDATLRVLGLA